VRFNEESESVAIGRLQLDASYSPVNRVSYTVDRARVEQRTDLDKLIIDIETNGTVNPEEAIRHAATILQDQLSAFVDLQARSEEKPRTAENDIDPIPAPGRRPGTDGPLRQLPEGREHLLHRRPDPAHRGGTAQNTESGQEVADGDQGRACHQGSFTGYAPRKLAAIRIEGKERGQRLTHSTGSQNHAPSQLRTAIEPQQQSP
jgi:hypothetical protein